MLKSPQHLEQFPVLADVFPDATFVVTHRDPVAVTASMTTMVTYGARLSVAHPDPVAYGAHWRTAPRADAASRACVIATCCPTAQSIDVRFDEFMADEFAMVERIYELADQPMTTTGRVAHGRFIADHPRGRHGAVEYDITQFGLDPVERRAALRFYTDRFGITLES